MHARGKNAVRNVGHAANDDTVDDKPGFGRPCPCGKGSREKCGETERNSEPGARLQQGVGLIANFAPAAKADSDIECLQIDVRATSSWLRRRRLRHRKSVNLLVVRMWLETCSSRRGERS